MDETILKKVKQYVWNVLIAIDQLANAILLGDPDETISSRCGKWVNSENKIKRSIAKPLAWFLDKIDKNHCKDAIERDEGKHDLL